MALCLKELDELTTFEGGLGGKGNLEFSNKKEKIELIIDGEEVFKEIISCIKSARDSIHITAHIWRDDEIGNALAKEVLSAANRGVRVMIEKDQLGAVAELSDQNGQSLFHKDLWKQNPMMYLYCICSHIFYNKLKFFEKYPLQDDNEVFNKLDGHKNITLDSNSELNDHSKYFIFDDKELSMGGVNIGDEYHKEWHDYMVKVSDQDLLKVFNERLEGGDSFEGGKEGIDFILNSKGLDRRHFNVRRKFIDLFDQAKEKIVIEMPYFGDFRIHKKIIEAAWRGVEIELIVPSEADILQDINMSLFKDLYELGLDNIKIYMYDGMLHGKVVVIDDELAFLGSGNFTKHTGKMMLEANVLVDKESPVFVEKLMGQLEKDKLKSKLVEDMKEFDFDRFRAMIEGAYIEQEVSSKKVNRISSVIKTVRKEVRRMFSR